MQSAPVNRRGFLLLRRLLKLLLALPARWGKGYGVSGGERLPRSRRPMILVCNHAAFADTVWVALAVRPRFVVCGAKPKYFRTRTLRLLMAVANILRVDDRDTFRRDCDELLAAGEILLIYPEMGRNPRGLGELDTLAAEVAIAAGAPVLPCFLHGTTVDHRGPPRLFVGEEITLGASAIEETERLRRAIADLDPSHDESGGDG